MRTDTYIEPHGQNTTAKLNRLRAAVLGANDGITSVAGLVVGIAGATSDRKVILTAGLAGVVAGALSMAAGEYVSVSSQRDTEKSLIAKEKYELENFPKEELDELKQIYVKKGLSKKTANLVADELTEKDAHAAHLDAELAIDPHDLVNPWQAAIASGASFFGGSTLPILAILLSPENLRVPITFVSVIAALAITGALSAYVGRAPMHKAIVRVTLGGAFAMIITYGIGRLIGTTSL